MKEKRGRDVKTDPESEQPPEKLQFLSRPEENFIDGTMVRFIMSIRFINFRSNSSLKKAIFTAKSGTFKRSESA